MFEYSGISGPALKVEEQTNTGPTLNISSVQNLLVLPNESPWSKVDLCLFKFVMGCRTSYQSDTHSVGFGEQGAPRVSISRA